MLDIETDQDAAAADSEDGEFAGQTLQGYSYRRERAAHALGLRYGTSKLMPADFRTIPNASYARKKELEKLKGKKRTEAVKAELEKLGDPDPEIDVYDGMAEDASIVVFVRTLKDSEVREVRSRVATYTDRFEDWVEANGLRTDGPNVREAVDIFVETLAAVKASRTEPVIPTGKGSEDSPNG